MSMLSHLYLEEGHRRLCPWPVDAVGNHAHIARQHLATHRRRHTYIYAYTYLSFYISIYLYRGP